MGDACSKKYSLNKSKADKGFIIINENERHHAITYAMEHGKRVRSSFTDYFEEYLLNNGFFRIDNKEFYGDDIEVHSTTEERLAKLIKEELLLPLDFKK